MVFYKKLAGNSFSEGLALACGSSAFLTFFIKTYDPNFNIAGLGSDPPTCRDTGTGNITSMDQLHITSP